MNQSKLVISLLSLFSTATFAHTVMKDEALPIAIHNWTGFYAGLNAGASQHTMNMTDNQATTFNATIQQPSNREFTGGFQVGYRYQLNPNMTSGVFGLELSSDFSNVTFDKQYGSAFSLYQLSAKNELKNVSLLELTGGIAADKTLLFLAAGLSWSNITGSVTNTASVPFFNSFNVSKKVMGTAVGGGIEYAFNEQISARIKIDVVTPNNYTTSDNLGDNFQISNHIVQGTFGVNYKFA